MSLGLWEAARRARRRVEAVMAVDFDEHATGVYALNFPGATIKTADVKKLFDGPPGNESTDSEKAIKRSCRDVSILIGGPPCQGHSDLNNHTRRNDPKNGLYVKMARAAEVLEPTFVIVENVPAVMHDTHGVVDTTTEILEKNGYTVDSEVFELLRLGIPQRRRRHLLIASRRDDWSAADILDELDAIQVDKRHVRWAIGDLIEAPADRELNRASRISDENKDRIAYLFRYGKYDLPNHKRPTCHQNEDHSYKSVYGRLDWDKPAQTITTGFTSMGQGRYVHPELRRTLTPHEAARLQTFPDWFDWGDAKRTQLSKMIGNAVPPLLIVTLGSILIEALK